MSRRYAEDLIETLTRGGFRAECPECGEAFGLGRAGLFYLDNFTPAAKTLHERSLAELAEQRRDIAAMPRTLAEESEDGAHAVNLGCILERLAPSLETFPFPASECRSISDPIDFLVFRGLARSSAIDEIAFVEIKSGKSRLSNRQKDIRDAVNAGKVTFDVYEPGDQS